MIRFSSSDCFMNVEKRNLIVSVETAARGGLAILNGEEVCIVWRGDLNVSHSDGLLH